MEGSIVAKTKICRLGLILKTVPLRSPTYRLFSSSKTMPVATPMPSTKTDMLPLGRHLINDAVEAAGNVNEPVAADGDSGGVHHVVDERRHVEIQVDAVDGDRNLLAARSAEGRVNIADRIDRRAGHRVQIFGDLDADVAGPGFARAVSPFSTISSPAEAPSGTLTITSELEPMTTGAATSPMVTCGRSDVVEALPADVKFPARDRRFGLDLGDTRSAVGIFANCHVLLISHNVGLMMIEPSHQK